VHRKFTAAVAICWLASVGLACSFLPRTRAAAWQLTLEIDAPAVDREALANQTVRVIEGRLNALGVSNFQVQTQGAPASGRILVSLPEVPDRERVKNIIIAEGQLELVAVISPPSPALVQTYSTQPEAAASLGKTAPANRSVLPYLERDFSGSGPPQKKWVVVERPAIVDGSDLRNATASQSPAGDEDYQIQFSLRPDGAEKFAAWTGSHINDYLGVVLNGEVKSIAFIKSQISDQGEINGRFTKQSAEDLALILRSGALPVPVRIVEESAAR
jgi:preprotein translocase subunit SecD